jgi:hypothetical protein
MIAAGRWGHRWALIPVILLAGCASLPPPREVGHPVSPPTRDELITRLQIREEKLHSLRGIATVEVTLNEETRRFREALAVQSDGRFRLETLGALGLPVLTIASDGGRVVVQGGSDGRDLSSDGCRLLNRLFGLHLPPAALARVLAGFPPLPVPPSADVLYLPERRAYLLEGQNRDWVQRLYLDPSGALVGGEVWEGRRGLHFSFSDVREMDDIFIPMRITLTHVGRPSSVAVTYQTIDVNPALADHLFLLPLPIPAEGGGC